MLPALPPVGAEAIEAFLVDELAALVPPPRGEEGLGRARRFFARLGNPQDHCLQIHVVGTAGKGTAVTAIVARLLGGGLSVGAHLSPHVVDLRERMLVDGALPTWDEMAAALSEAWPAMRETEQLEGRLPSFFEVTIALSWLLGRRAGVDVHVTEAGIGGALDPTNSINRADTIAVVMPIGYDHVDVLGPGLASIAENKAAVIVAGSDVVVAPQPYLEAAEVIAKTAADRAAWVHQVTDRDLGRWRETATSVADVVATLVAERLEVELAPTTSLVELPGRLEDREIAGRRLILDGAHNPLKLGALGAALAHHGIRPMVVVAALSQEKDLDACATELATMADRIVTTDFSVRAGDRILRRSWPADELAEAIERHRPHADVIAVPGVDAAAAEARAATNDGDTILATGSFLLLDPFRRAMAAG